MEAVSSRRESGLKDTSWQGAGCCSSTRGLSRRPPGVTDLPGGRGPRQGVRWGAPSSSAGGVYACRGTPWQVGRRTDRVRGRQAVAQRGQPRRRTAHCCSTRSPFLAERRPEQAWASSPAPRALTTAARCRPCWPRRPTARPWRRRWPTPRCCAAPAPAPAAWAAARSPPAEQAGTQEAAKSGRSDARLLAAAVLRSCAA